MRATPSASPPSPSTASPATLPSTTCGIAAGRLRIDALDEEIIALVRRRLEVSGGIQAQRVASGGRRIEHSREVEIVNRYAAAFGRPGADLALALLTLARGGARGSGGRAVVRKASAGRDSLA
jgi:chorismate mutase